MLGYLQILYFVLNFFNYHLMWHIICQLTIGPVASVGDWEHGGAVEGVLHHAGQVEHLGCELGPAGAILLVRLGDDWHPLLVGPRPADAVRQEGVDVLVVVELVGFGVAQGHLSLQPAQLQSHFWADREIITLQIYFYYK